MAHAVLTDVDDTFEFLVNTRGNLSVDITSGEATLERYLPSQKTWKPVQEYSSSSEDIVNSGGMGARHRVRMTSAGDIKVEVW